MTFIFLIFTTAFLMEAIGSYISIFGLSALFAGDIIILGMALILDIAKVVSVSFLYQYWKDIKAVMRYYMLAAVIVLMIITSAGAFGYLSGAFQKAMQPNMEVMLKVESFKHEQERLTAEKTQLIDQRTKIDEQIANLPASSIKGRRQLIASFKPEIDRIASRIETVTKRSDELTSEILKTESDNIEKTVHTGPITYISKAFDISVEDASKWIILTIISVFDPLAVILIIAGNFLVALRKTIKINIPRMTEALASPSIQIESGLSREEKREAIIAAAEDPYVYSPEFSTIPLSTEYHGTDEKIIESEKEHWSNKGIEGVAGVSDDDLDNALSSELSELNVDSLSQEEIEFLVQGYQEPVNPEANELIQKVYDSIDTGEEPDDEIFEPELAEVVHEYVPIAPIEVEVESSYEGSPQAELIDYVQNDQPMRSSLEDLTISLPQALFQESGRKSTKRQIYAQEINV